MQDRYYHLLKEDVGKFGRLFYEVNFGLQFNILHIEYLHHRSISMFMYDTNLEMQKETLSQSVQATQKFMTAHGN